MRVGMNEAFTELLVTVVLGLYPREWRKRYGGEIRELIQVLNVEHRRSLVQMVPSLIAGATVERVHALRRLDRAGLMAALLVTLVAVSATFAFSHRVAVHPGRPAALSPLGHGVLLGRATAPDATGR